jgi:hypothetical protein
VPSHDPILRQYAATKASRARLAGRSGADLRELTEKARATLRERDLQAVDPDGQLPEDERERLADELRRERMRDMSRKSAEVRSARAARDRAERYQALAEEAERRRASTQ